MKAHLLDPVTDFDAAVELPSNEEDLTQDLGVDLVIDAMARGDETIAAIARRVILASLTDPATIRFRQQILTDCLTNPELPRRLYELANAAIAAERRVFRFGKRAEAVLHQGVQALDVFVEHLQALRRISQECRATCSAPGLSQMFATVTDELDDEYFDDIAKHLQNLRFRDGVLVSARLGAGNKASGLMLRHAEAPPRRWRDRIRGQGDDSLTVRIAERDEAGFRALGEMRERGVNLAANAIAQSNDHIRGYFTSLRDEIAFYLGCVNLHQTLADRDAVTCVPDPLPLGPATTSFRGLYDIGLSVRNSDRIVSNDLDAPRSSLLVITGANQGGKSTYLRALGLAQLMMQAGMFVAAESFQTTVCQRVFTHYRREEDAEMNSGKLDEELRRMSSIADELTPHSLVLFNESFAATNEREGAEIARQIIRALIEADVSVYFVTHLYDLASSLHRQRSMPVVSLRAERDPSGQRSYLLTEGPPLPTSYGTDLYERIFGEDLDLDLDATA